MSVHMHSSPDACVNSNYGYDIMQKMCLRAIQMYLVGDGYSSSL